MVQVPDWTSLQGPVPTPSYRRVQVDNSAAEVDDQISRLGQGLEQASDQIYSHNVNMARAQASSALVDHELAVKTQTQQIRQDVADGKLTWDQAPQAFDKWQSSQQASPIDNLDPVGQENFERGMKRTTYQGALEVQGIAAAGKKQAFVDNFQTTMDSLGKLAGMPNADIQGINNQIDSYRPMAIEAGIQSAQVDKALQSFKDRNWLNQATQRSMEAKESLPALNQLQHDLTDADGFYAGRLDTEKRNMVLRSVENDQIILQNRIEHEQDKREARAQATIGRMEEQNASGIPPTPDMIEQWQSQTKGTSFEDDFKQRLKDGETIQQVLRMPPDQQETYVQQREAQLYEQGGTLRDKATLMGIKTAINQNVNLMQKSPLLFAQNRTGTEVQPLDFSAITPTSPVADAVKSLASANGQPQPDPKQTFQAEIADRMATLKSLRTQYGAAITPTPLLPQEVTALSQNLESATPQQRAQMLVSLRGAMNDDTAYQNAMRQIAPHSPVTAIAGSMVGSSAPAATPSWFSQDFAPKLSDVQMILRGEQLLNPASGGKAAAAEAESGKGSREGMPMPEEKGFAGTRAAFANAAGDVFRDRPELGEAYYSVFKDAYAALLAQKGDMKGQGDDRLQKQALQMALGNRVQFNGNTVSVPPGMDPSSFEGLLKNAVAGTAAQLKAPGDWQDRIQGYGIREVGGLGSGRYLLTNGNMPLQRPDGKGLFTVDLRDQYLGARGLHRGEPDHGSPADQDTFLAAHTK